MRVDDAAQREARTRERQIGGRRPKLVVGQGQKAVAAGIHGGAVNTRHRAERRGDKIGSSEEESQDV